MSKRIVISESEKNEIMHLYRLNESRRVDTLNGETFQINVGGGLRTYKINGIYPSRKFEGQFTVETTQLKTNDRGGVRVFGDENASKKFKFSCKVGYLGGYNERDDDYIDSEMYPKLEINELIKTELCK